MPNTLGLTSDGVAMPSKLRTLVQAPKPEITIELHNPKRTYTTLDRIQGVASIVAPADTPFDVVDIEFIGWSRAFVQRLTTAAASTGRAEAFHQFLKLTQPALAQHYPENLVLRAGVRYDFPFVFAVPQQLLLRTCQHHVSSDTVRDAHLRLPPTFGDQDLARQPGTLDDLAPEMATIRYGVAVKLSAFKTKGDSMHRTSIAAKARRVRVVPAIEEQPPLDVHEEDGEYVMRKEKSIRKTMLSGKSGWLVMQAAQPRALKLESYANPDSRTDTVVKVGLRYDPADDKSLPPKLGSLASRLRLTTYFGCTARRSFPCKAKAYMDMSQGMHSEQVNLSSRAMAAVEWTRHESADDVPLPVDSRRRDSATSVLSYDGAAIPEPSEGYKGKAFYTARLVIPVRLPTNKAFPPTFHSCLISRVYALKLDMNLQSAGIAPSMELKLPVQISTEGLVNDEFARTTSVDYTVDADVDADDGSFEPRVMGVPDESFVGRSRIGSQPGVPAASPAPPPAASPSAAEPPPDYAQPPEYSPSSSGRTRAARHSRSSVGSLAHSVDVSVSAY